MHFTSGSTCSLAFALLLTSSFLLSVFAAPVPDGVSTAESSEAHENHTVPLAPTDLNDIAITNPPVEPKLRSRGVIPTPWPVTNDINYAQPAAPPLDKSQFPNAKSSQASDRESALDGMTKRQVMSHGPQSPDHTQEAYDAEALYEAEFAAHPEFYGHPGSPPPARMLKTRRQAIAGAANTIHVPLPDPEDVSHPNSQPYP